MATHAPAGTPCTCGERGWMPGIEHVAIQWSLPEWIASRDGRMAPVAIVDHIAQGFQSTIVGWASNGGSKIITHFSVGRDGRKVQHHSVFTPGIHVSGVINPVARVALTLGAPVRGANTYTIGIEHEGCSVDPRPAYTVPAELIYSRANPWPEPMIRSSIEIKRWCFANVPSLGAPSRDSVIGHYEIDARNRIDDPAASSDRSVWPVERMLRELGSAGASDTYTVQRGDTLSHIALRHGVATADLARWNGITDANSIEVGRVLHVVAPLEAATPLPSPASSKAALTASLEAVQAAIKDLQEAERTLRAALQDA